MADPHGWHGPSRPPRSYGSGGGPPLGHGPSSGQRRPGRLGFIIRVAVLVWLGLFLFGGLSGLAAGVFGRFVRGGPPMFFPGFLIPVGIVAFLLVGRAVRRYAAPIADVMAAAGRVAQGDYSVAVAERGPREVRDLIAQFNAMTRRIGADEAQRRRLLADIAHELRTPLAVLQGNVEGMLDGVYPRDDAHLEPLVAETQIMARLLEDLRTLSMAESGALRLHREELDLVALTQQAVRAQQPAAQRAGVTCAAEISEGIQAHVLADPVRVREILANLLGNAIRHTPAGGEVRVAIAPTGLPDGTPAAAVSVTDTGEGVDPEVLPHMFDRYARSDRTGGTGLGLAVTRDLVHAHGGRIRATSEPGRGTTVTFALPLAPSARPSAIAGGSSGGSAP